LTTTFAEGKERNTALGAWGGVGAFGAVAGGLLGGVLTELLSWNWIFFVNVPVGLIGLALAPILLTERRDARIKTFDLPGAALFATFLMPPLSMQQVLHCSAMKTGAAYLAAPGTAILWSALAAQRVSRGGVKPVLGGGMTALSAGLIYSTQVSAGGSYLGDLL